MKLNNLQYYLLIYCILVCLSNGFLQVLHNIILIHIIHHLNKGFLERSFYGISRDLFELYNHEISQESTIIVCTILQYLNKGTITLNSLPENVREKANRVRCSDAETEKHRLKFSIIRKHYFGIIIF